MPKNPIPGLLAQIDKLNNARAAQSISELGAGKYHEYVKVEHVYNTNALSGNTISHRQTALILHENVTISGKSAKEHLDIINTALAYDYMIELASTAGDLTVRDIKQLHSLVLGDNPKHKGVFRKENVFIAGSQVKTTEYLQIDTAMDDLLSRYLADENHPLVRIAQFHIDFEHIHPFLDGNGRTGRLLLNLELIKHGYLPVNLKYANRDVYMGSLEKAQTTGQSHDFMLHFLQQQLEQQERQASLTGSSVIIPSS